jgi:hypothetical protein
MTVASAAESGLPWVMGLALGAASGKAAGGGIADRFGWRPVAVGALLLSLPLISVGAGTAGLGIFGMFLFQVPTGVILVVIARGFPGRPAFAFGLAAFALLLGAFPMFTTWKDILTDPWVNFFLASASTVALWVGLRRLSDAAATSLRGVPAVE